MSGTMDDWFGSDAEQENEAENVTQEVGEEAPVEENSQTEVDTQDATEQSGEQVAEEADHDQDVAQESAEKRSNDVPIATFLDMRDKAKDAENARKVLAQEAEQLRQELDAIRNPQRAQYDNLSDPTFLLTEVERRVQDALFEERANRSSEAAEAKYGEEALMAAVNWATSRNDPALRAEIRRQADPAEWVYQQHKAATAFENFQRDPDEYVRQRAKELGLYQQATAPVAAVPQQQRQEKKLPASITNIPAANATAARPVQDAMDFNSIFDR